MPPCNSEKLLELGGGKVGVGCYRTHRVGVDVVVARDGQANLPVGHDDMFALADNPESRLAQCSNGMG